MINLFPEGKPKQGIFIVLTQSRAWKLQAIGDEPDTARGQWMKALESWLNDNRPGFKKLKKMGFEKPTVVQGLAPMAMIKRASMNDVAPQHDPESQSSSPPPASPAAAAPLSSSAPDVDDKREQYGVGTMKATALNYRRLELQIKVAQDSVSTSAGNAELLARLRKLEEEREEKRAAAALREFQLSELEREYAAAANTSRSDFQELLKRVSDFHAKLLKPGFEKIQAIYESLQEGDEPELSRQESFELLSHFDAMLPPVEAALRMSTTLLQKDKAGMLQRVAALEAENKALQESLDELEQKKVQVQQSSEHLREICSQTKHTAEVFPTVTLSKEHAVEWLKIAHDDTDPLMQAIIATAATVDARDDLVGDESVKLMLMEKMGDNPAVLLAEDGSIKAATVDALFSMLINGEGRIKHPEFEDAILYGFPSFAQPMDLLEKLVLCFCSTVPPNYEGARQRAEAIVEMNRKRLLSLMNKWMLYHEDHFREKNFSRFLQDFIVTVELSGLKDEAQKLRDKVNSNIFPFTGEYAQSILPPDLSNFHLLDLTPVEVARQMTRLDAALFEVIETRDFLETAWTSKNPNVATSVKAITKQFNRMSQWVASMILREEDLRRRSAVIEFFIMTAETCLQLNNFNGLLQIIGSLSKTEIHRLTNSWELVAKEKMKLFEAHRELLQSNCSLLRQRYAAAKPPCLPYLGTYLTDLVMIGEQKTRIGDKVNYRKLQLQERSLSALVRRNEEGIKFPFREVKEIRSLITDDSRLFKTDDELMKRSLELEPRAAEGGTAKISKTKSVSSLIRNDSKARVVRKGVGNADRGTLQLPSPSPSTLRKTEESPMPSPTSNPNNLGRKPSSTVLNHTSSGTLPSAVVPGGAERGPPPPLPPLTREGPASPRDKAGSPVPSMPMSPNEASFRTVRSGMRASSPAGTVTSAAVAAAGSPMIGKRMAGSGSGRGSAGEGGVLSSSPESGSGSLITSPKMMGKVPPQAAPRRDLSKAPGPVGAKSPAPRKALPKPPQDDGSAQSDEEEEEGEYDL